MSRCLGQSKDCAESSNSDCGTAARDRGHDAELHPAAASSARKASSSAASELSQGEGITP
jgi:hypothetical protein